MSNLFFSDTSPVNYWASIVGQICFWLAVLFTLLNKRKKTRGYFVISMGFCMFSAGSYLFAAAYLSKNVDTKIVFWIVILLLAIIFFLLAAFKKKL